MRVSRRTVFALAIVAIFLGIIFEKQNVAFMVSLAFALAINGQRVQFSLFAVLSEPSGDPT